MIALILAGAAFLTLAMGYIGLPRHLAEWIGALGLSPFALIVALTVFYIVLGCFLDGISMVVLTMGVILPTVQKAGIDLIWFGIFIVLVVEMAQITPPVGFNLFVLQGMTGRDISPSARCAAAVLPDVRRGGAGGGVSRPRTLAALDHARREIAHRIVRDRRTTKPPPMELLPSPGRCGTRLGVSMRRAREQIVEFSMEMGPHPGEMRRRVDEFDWAATPLGPRDHWSASLTLTVGLVLDSGFPMTLRWGRRPHADLQ